MLFQSESLCDVQQRIIVCEENGMKYIAYNVNDSSIFKYQIDGTIVQDNTNKRCDYLVENETKKAVYLVELKGCDVSKACEQIESTIIHFSHLLNSYNKHSRIVCSRVATSYINDSHYRSLKRKCQDIIVKTKQYDENI